jgi:hypothetical protein
MHWVTFDEDTSSVLRSEFAHENVMENRAPSALQYALQRDQTLVAVLPCGEQDQAAVAVFRWNKTAQVSRQSTPAEAPVELKSSRPMSTSRAGGFLGLADEPVFEEEQMPEKRGWWRRFWDY